MVLCSLEELQVIACRQPFSNIDNYAWNLQSAMISFPKVESRGAINDVTDLTKGGDTPSAKVEGSSRKSVASPRSGGETGRILKPWLFREPCLLCFFASFQYSGDRSVKFRVLGETRFANLSENSAGRHVWLTFTLLKFSLRGFSRRPVALRSTLHVTASNFDTVRFQMFFRRSGNAQFACSNCDPCHGRLHGAGHHRPIGNATTVR